VADYNESSPVAIEVGFRAPRLDKLISQHLEGYSRAEIQRFIAEGAVTVDGELCRPSFKPAAGAVVEIVVPDRKETGLKPEDLDLEIVYQDADMVVVNKRAGMVVHPSKGHYSGTLVNGLLHALAGLSTIGGEERPGIVHRLDKGTSGLMVVACNNAAHANLQAQFADHSAGRRYYALTLGSPDLDGGVIRSTLGRDAKDRMRYSSGDKGKLAVTNWRVKERFGSSPRPGKKKQWWASLLEFKLETGRTHQIRVHSLEMGHPVLCDPLYKSRRQPPVHVHDLLRGIDHQLLHAHRLDLKHPKTGEQLSFEAEPPADFQAVLELFKG
jgi:23S rRNA pseudouridine1911/1915/1917 synthase